MQVLKNKKAALGPGAIKGTLVTMIFFVVLVAMLPTLIELGADKTSDLAAVYSDNSTLFGDAAPIGEELDDFAGYFWVAGPLILIIGIIGSIFLKRRY